MNNEQEQPKESVSGGHSGSTQQENKQKGWDTPLIAAVILIAVAALIAILL